MKNVNVIGAGLAGAEACNFLLNHGIHVTLFEMRPKKSTKAHHSDLFAELVCSNSLKNNSLDNACGLLKEEMRMMHSITMESAKKYSVPSGAALSVDRTLFSRYITEKIITNPNLSLVIGEVESIPAGVTIIATGPLTSDKMIAAIKKIVGGDKFLSFFDASAPIINKNSIDFSKVFVDSKFNMGKDYINCSLTRDEYYKFVDELIHAKLGMVHSFDKEYFEGCMPIEVMAKQGPDTLRFGPLSPIGFAQKPLPYAVVQLRQDDLIGEMYNIVGFQTNLFFSEQKRVFSLIPGLGNVDFIRYGLMHRNFYLRSPAVLNPDFSLKANSKIIVAGQLSGVEGYVESAATGIIAGLNAYRILNNQKTVVPPIDTMIGALMNYVANSNPLSFSPMNANYAIYYNKRRLNRNEIASVAIESITKWYQANE